MSTRAARLELERILASRTFSRSGRMTRFLRYTVEQALEGRADELKEYALAVEVFDRKPSFDSRLDPIVRVEARRLRSKLRQYYESEGARDEIEIEYPTGSYVPRYHRRKLAMEPAVSPLLPPPCHEEKSIVVLPFANLSAEPENEYFSDGLTEQIIHELTKLEGLRVVSWQSAFQLKGRPYDLRTIGEQLHVGAVIGGSVRRSGERVRIAAQLVLIEDGRYLWSETYERQMRDVLGVQDEISRSIAETLRLKLVGGRAPAKRRDHDPVAYNLYLRGRFHWNKRSSEELRKSIQHYERAIAVDAAFPLAYAGLADAYSLLADYGFSAPSEIMPKAKAAAEKALALDSTLAEAHTSLGFIQSLYEWNWIEAEEHYRKAIALNPGYATAHHWYGLDFLALMGRFEEAQAEMRVAVQLDPLSPIINEGAGYVLMLLRRYEDAIEQYRKVLDLDPDFYKSFTAMGRAYNLMGRYEEAIAMFEKGRSLAGDVPSILGALGQTCALAGRGDEARRIIEQLAALSERGHVPSTCFALVHLGLGEKDRALQWLELACGHREVPVTSLKVHPAYDGLRKEARFAALLRRMGLE